MNDPKQLIADADKALADSNRLLKKIKEDVEHIKANNAKTQTVIDREIEAIVRETDNELTKLVKETEI